jgi:hypothetical protein
MRFALGALFVLLLPAIGRAEDGVTAEAKRRHDDLLRQGFNFTYGVSVTKEATRVEMWVPSSDQEHVMARGCERERCRPVSTTRASSSGAIRDRAS